MGRESTQQLGFFLASGLFLASNEVKNGFEVQNEIPMTIEY
jgi:hypothetical protein